MINADCSPLRTDAKLFRTLSFDSRSFSWNSPSHRRSVVIRRGNLFEDRNLKVSNRFAVINLNYGPNDLCKTHTSNGHRTLKSLFEQQSCRRERSSKIFELRRPLKAIEVKRLTPFEEANRLMDLLAWSYTKSASLIATGH